MFKEIQNQFKLYNKIGPIQELNMTEPVFQIITHKREKRSPSKTHRESDYHKMSQNYLSQSYGYYIEIFLKKICLKAQKEFSKLLKFQLRKLVRQMVKKFMMNDFEVVFVSYFATLHEWNYSHQIIEQTISEQGIQDPQLIQTKQLRLFLQFICFFVKSYIGQEKQIQVICEHQSSKLPYFSKIYKIWMDHNPKKLFHISPRQLNAIYSQHSRNCRNKAVKKDYNNMVDQILQLSTTYSIMPSRQKKKSQKRYSHEELPVYTKKVSKSFQSNLLQFSPLRELGDFKKRGSFIIGGSSNLFIEKPSDMFQTQKPTIQSKLQLNSSQNEKKVIVPTTKKLVSLSKKNKSKQDGVNNVVKHYFTDKEKSEVVQDIRKGQQSSGKDMIPGSFLDMNMRSSRIQNLPFQLRSNSNIFGPSQLF